MLELSFTFSLPKSFLLDHFPNICIYIEQSIDVSNLIPFFGWIKSLASKVRQKYPTMRQRFKFLFHNKRCLVMTQIDYMIDSYFIVTLYFCPNNLDYNWITRSLSKLNSKNNALIMLIYCSDSDGLIHGVTHLRNNAFVGGKETGKAITS